MADLEDEGDAIDDQQAYQHPGEGVSSGREGDPDIPAEGMRTKTASMVRNTREMFSSGMPGRTRSKSVQMMER